MDGTVTTWVSSQGGFLCMAMRRLQDGTYPAPYYSRSMEWEEVTP